MVIWPGAMQLSGREPLGPHRRFGLPNSALWRILQGCHEPRRGASQWLISIPVPPLVDTRSRSRPMLKSMSRRCRHNDRSGPDLLTRRVFGQTAESVEREDSIGPSWLPPFAQDRKEECALWWAEHFPSLPLLCFLEVPVMSRLRWSSSPRGIARELAIQGSIREGTESLLDGLAL